MMGYYRFIKYNKYTTVAVDFDRRGGCAYVEENYMGSFYTFHSIYSEI
jgi:hypothetical protein